MIVHTSQNKCRILKCCFLNMFLQNMDSLELSKVILHDEGSFSITIIRANFIHHFKAKLKIEFLCCNIALCNMEAGMDYRNLLHFIKYCQDQFGANSLSVLETKKNQYTLTCP